MRALGLSLWLSTLLLLVPIGGYAAETLHNKQTQDVENIKEPIYNPFIERYVLDELKILRTDMNNLHVDLTKEITNRDIGLTTRAVGYATDTVTYFFYLIAGISSVLVLLGWNSIRDIKDKVHNLADAKVSEVIDVYEERLAKLEEELHRKSKGLSNAHKQISQHQDIHSLWLKAGQETLTNNRIKIYDQILAMDPENVEALTYKADAALEMDEPQWAINLCQRALEIEPEHRHAYYQMAGAYALMDQPNEALDYLELALKDSDVQAEEVLNDSAFISLKDLPRFKELLHIDAD
ncbi:tetratricopeptide repeat protein [Thiomicrorhabdus sediminis]|uniref:Uncharacterized protein n=1 Tax=Thiomicrorhabdus sediminis TaxID=2580412 RepID=A0A4P9K3L5_9GAMM|nr:CDC27 family protein [Thiomicrorhabdus sediminis]QCU89445.1 hypothetical protein FE785_01750 [Thiomicrorhabdus sediminis]